MSLLLLGNKKRDSIIKSNLALWLDMKDFSNSPPTNALKDKAITSNIAYTNMLTNGDMEAGTTYATGYTQYGLSQANWSLDTTVFHSGTKCQKIVANAPSGQIGLTFNKPVVIGHKYYLSYWSYMPSTNTGIIYNDLFVDAVSMSKSIGNSSSTKDKWNKISGMLTALQSSGQIWMRATNTSAIGDILYLDDAILVDLTDTYGSGNEPNITWCDANIVFSPTRVAGSYNYNNMAQYTQSTFAEWTLSANTPLNGNPTVSNNNLTFTISAGTTDGYIAMGIPNCNFKTSTKYGVLINVPINTINTVFKFGSEISLQPTVIPTNTTGNCKSIITTLATITTNKLSFYSWNAVVGGVLKMNSIRVFELPVNSQIEYDFNNLTADQLSAIYLMSPKGVSSTSYKGNDAIPSGLAYTNMSGSDNNGGVVLDGVDDLFTVPNSSIFNFGGNDFTIAMSVIFKSIGNKGLISKRTAWNNNDGFYCFFNATTLQFIYTVNAINYNVHTFNFIPILGIKYRLVVRRIGSSLKFYANNILLGETNIGTSIIFSSTEPLKIGSLTTNGTILYPSDIVFSNSFLIYNGLGFTDSNVASDYRLNK